MFHYTFSCLISIILFTIKQIYAILSRDISWNRLFADLSHDSVLKNKEKSESLWINRLQNKSQK